MDGTVECVCVRWCIVLRSDAARLHVKAQQADMSISKPARVPEHLKLCIHSETQSVICA